MSLKDTAVVRAYHDDRIKRFGMDATEALGWKNKDSQQQKFHDLDQIGELQGCSVLDLGCGHGDLFPHLEKAYSEIRYTGVDNVKAFLNVAVQRFGTHSNSRFILGEFSSMQLPKSDFVICSGALNYRNSEPNYLYLMINRFFEAASIGMGLNLLNRVDFENGVLAYFDPVEVAEYCRQLTSQVEVRLSHDEDYFTLFLYRDDRTLKKGL